MSARFAFRRFRHDRRAAAAAEFAILAPVMIVLFFGGFALCEAVSLSRKVTITTRAMADLTSQYTSMAAGDMSLVMNASTQIIAPFDATPLALRISEITTDVTGLQGWVTWSSATNMTPYTQNCRFQLPAGILGLPNTSFIYAESSYAYKLPFSVQLVPTINLADRIFMLPRLSSSISYSGPQITGTCGPQS